MNLLTLFTSEGVATWKATLLLTPTAFSPGWSIRVVSRFLSRRFHPKSRRLFRFYFSNITLRTDLLTFQVSGAIFKIAGEMRWLPAYFDNAASGGSVTYTG